MENFTSNYDALQAAAERATKGNWINVGAWVENERDDLKDICDCRPNGNEDDEQALLDAAYIALANPDTILRLLREWRTAREATSQHPTQASVAANQLCLCGTVLAHTHHHCATPVMWRMYEESNAFRNTTAAARDILTERHRQIQHEGLTPDRDDGYTEAELPRAAAAYVLSACGFSNAVTLDFWPWITDWWKPTTPRRNLVKAAALILAEIERIDRDPGDESHHDHLNGGSL
ncbi:hypothetical protein CUJ89_13380 [Burkholderia pyrrocinia]|uniref:Phage protein n=1 Tax=Burkholderia pyrrocinia TaxID=60550 RepID=A0A2Z5MX86_BURPY|nr:ead/Ea22-like family protein [Burkholderia pyrrocinia]AXF21376.1 hypothetical protein CUJ89_13380 [Burkholderia pyrrocinia]